MSIPHIIAISIVVGAALCATLIYHIGTIASASAPARIGPPPPDLQATPVIIDSASGSPFAAWVSLGTARRGFGAADAWCPGEPARHGGSGALPAVAAQ